MFVLASRLGVMCGRVTLDGHVQELHDGGSNCRVRGNINGLRRYPHEYLHGRSGALIPIRLDVSDVGFNHMDKLVRPAPLLKVPRAS